MKNILKTLAVTAALVGMSGGIASAATCTIHMTGSGSVNACYSEEENTTTITCTNDVDVDNDSEQTAGTGSATVEGNVTGGDSQSGNSENYNFTNVAVELGCEKPVEATPTTPTTPAGGNGGSTPQVLSDATQQVAVKPVGGAGAGAGAGASTNTAAATTGILASASLIAAGLALRKHALSRN